MALIRRMSRLFTADLHAVLDQIEEPETLLKQAIREMEEELAKQAQRFKWLQQERDELVSREQKLASAPAEIDARLDICFANGSEELARRLTRRKLQAEQLAQRVAAKRAATEAALQAHRAGIQENRERLEGMQQKAECFASECTSSYSEASDFECDSSLGEDEVEVAFLREKQKRSPS